MKTDLSSHIVLDRVSQCYYRPENEYELSVLTRYEKVPARIYESSIEVSQEVARIIASKIIEKQSAGKNFVLALPGGHSPQNIYQNLVSMHKYEGLSFKNVIIFNIYEFYPLAPQSNSNLKLLKETLLNQVDITLTMFILPTVLSPKRRY
jgi:glucosamine-6-phosphate deaminase